jgi:dihydrolipoamide dehydrogenase
MQTQFDVVVVGGGPAGKATAVHAADAGLSVAVIERELVGGECPYAGCMPSKALLRPAIVLAEAARVPGAAEAVTGPIDVTAALHRRDQATYFRNDTSHSSRLAAHEVHIFRGDARFVAERTVEVAPHELRPGDTRGDAGTTMHSSVVLEAKKAVVVCTGTRAAIPPVEGLSNTRYWTNVEATNAKTVPESLIVLGGGAIGCELAQAWHSLGCDDVTIIEAASVFLPREEPFASKLLTDELRKCGLDLRFGTAAVRVERVDGDESHVKVTLDDGTAVTAAELLVATGRQPNTDTLNLSAVGVKTDERGFLRTDKCMLVPASKGWMYAVGDVTGRALFTHTAVYHAQIAARNIEGEECDAVSDLAGAPRVVFTEPQIASAGHTEVSAREAGIQIVVSDRDIDRLAAASFYGKGAPAKARLIFDADSQVLIGATFVGPHVAELLHAATISISARLTLEQLRHAVAPFPTLSQIWTVLTDHAALTFARRSTAAVSTGAAAVSR